MHHSSDDVCWRGGFYTSHRRDVSDSGANGPNRAGLIASYPIVITL